MPAFGPVSRTALIRNLRALGFEGPFSGGKHQFMLKGECSVRVPNPHQGDIGKGLLARILRHARVSKADWEKL